MPAVTTGDRRKTGENSRPSRECRAQRLQLRASQQLSIHRDDNCAERHENRALDVTVCHEYLLSAKTNNP